MGSLVRIRDGLIGSWVRGAISPMDEVGQSVCEFMAWSHRRVEGTRTAIGSWVRGVISLMDEVGRLVCCAILPSRGGDEDGDMTGAISNSTARSLSLSLSLFGRLWVLSLSLSLSLSLFARLQKWFEGKTEAENIFRVKGAILLSK